MGSQRRAFSHLTPSNLMSRRLRPTTAMATAHSDWKNRRTNTSLKLYVVATSLFANTIAMENTEYSVQDAVAAALISVGLLVLRAFLFACAPRGCRRPTA